MWDDPRRKGRRRFAAGIYFTDHGVLVTWRDKPGQVRETYFPGKHVPLTTVIAYRQEQVLRAVDARRQRRRGEAH